MSLLSIYAAKQVLNQFRSQFLECLDANTIVYELHYRDIIAEGDLTDIRRTLAARQQNAILHACLLRTCDEEALMKVCEIIEQGYPTMKALGRKMKSMLDGKCYMFMHPHCMLSMFLSVNVKRIMVISTWPSWFL